LFARADEIAGMEKGKEKNVQHGQILHDDELRHR
jgi:hypothetical protein